jgi:hypothetical protein
MGRYARIMLAALLIVSGIFVFLPTDYALAGGTVDNQSFEEGTGEVPSAWNLTGNATRVDTGPIYTGNWAALITGENSTLTQWVYLGDSSLECGNETIPVLPMPITYNVWGWIYVSGNVTGVIAVDFWNGNETKQLSPTTILSTSHTNDTYVQLTGTGQSPPGAAYARIHLLGTGWSEGGEVRFDEVGFYPVTGFCFIATAAYGTETAIELDILRDFRDQVLLNNTLGSRFVEAYYKLSPPVADFIAKNDFLRAVARETLIDPIVNLLQWSQGLWST